MGMMKGGGAGVFFQGDDGHVFFQTVPLPELMEIIFPYGNELVLLVHQGESIANGWTTYPRGLFLGIISPDVHRPRSGVIPTIRHVYSHTNGVDVHYSNEDMPVRLQEKNQYSIFLLGNALVSRWFSRQRCFPYLFRSLLSPLGYTLPAENRQLILIPC